MVSEDGSVYSFGDNMVGQCGHGSDADEVAMPKQIVALSKYEVEHMHALVDLSLPDVFLKVKQVSAGSEHALFVLQSGRIWGCGSNEFGQLGIDPVTLCSQVSEF